MTHPLNLDAPLNEVWAVTSPEGELIAFNNKICRRLADEFKHGERDGYRAMARVCAALLDRLAKEFDHIELPECSVGDMIREFNIEAQKP